MASRLVQGQEGETGGRLADPPISYPIIPAGEQTVWADVSPLIASACNDLQDGQLIHGENFSLFAAMSALEIMDPKMDAGVEKCGYYSIEEAIENNVAPVPLSLNPTLDVQRVIDVIDHLFSCEATWYKGHTLAQTVFSCIYLLRIERTSSHALLHSYCRIMRATCNAVISVVSDSRTHEEEDLFTMAYGLPLKGEGDEKCLSILNSVEETISRQLRACKAQSLKKKQLEDIEPLQSNPDLEEGYCRALLCRLRFRKHYYLVLTSMKKPQGKGLELARKHVASCLSELTHITKSQEFLRALSYGFHQDDIQSSTTASGCRPIGFDASLNNRFSAPTPPRATHILSWKEAVSYFQKLLSDLDFVCSLNTDLVLDDVFCFIVQFQKPQPDLVARAHLQILLIQDGKLYGKEFFHDIISRELGLPELTKGKEHQKNEFIVQLGQLIINLLKILCANTAWQRRKLGKILQDWSVLSLQLEIAFKREIGETLNVMVDENMSTKVSKHLLRWTEERTYWIASRFLMLGFELELYSPYDYCMVYWFMYLVFMKLLEKIQLQTAANNENSQRKGKKKKDHGKDQIRDASFSSSTLLIHCYICLSEGLAMILAALRNESKAFHMVGPFNGEEERFIQHFDLLLKAHVPEHATYYLFKESTGHARISSIIKDNCFREAQKIITSLRGSYAGNSDKLIELQQLEQVAERNRVALSVIDQIGARDPSLTVSFEFTHHPHFAIAVIKRS
ncbi:N-alpha-acetyltransferase 35, NatC auxiliary subunit-like isoform X1 [Zingiber officinale]|uniref:N-alpha-acetyltransferase 35, NatC auxiliary subunit-like isoform X1 n=2 Tax=Zingiber officinale TaxID=94328 RepID=UPI001C4DB813|nr:N-alpha-acetyltransferase 35, NatC auxiliary subunit-like isoform X1 [Zingiber officinale]